MSGHASIEAAGPLDGLGEPSIHGQFVRFNVRSKDGRTIIVRLPFTDVASLTCDLVKILAWAHVPVQERPEEEIRAQRERIAAFHREIGYPTSSGPLHRLAAEVGPGQPRKMSETNPKAEAPMAIESDQIPRCDQLDGSTLKIVPAYTEAGRFCEANCITVTDGERTAIYVPMTPARRAHLPLDVQAAHKALDRQYEIDAGVTDG